MKSKKSNGQYVLLFALIELSINWVEKWRENLFSYNHSIEFCNYIIMHKNDILLISIHRFNASNSPNVHTLDFIEISLVRGRHSIILMH